MSNSKKLEIPGSKSEHNRNRRLPPRRGQIKTKIFKELVKFLAPMAGGGAPKPREDGGFLSSGSQTPAETPSGYCSDAQSDGP
ncbi:hypothetical protein D8674_021455 [Pyrus ussuriensis x Pyrus communis]|uniref:Uncharacterized protein n=1 Tax=Pyrus ussuriensis x Pyrus communis TaxID=2448454 RepID=A0A5N5GIB8_9ROSA|nr:hypothetical protein D8674_021455 [Pyrus ussuriensis x Pyrus communis]